VSLPILINPENIKTAKTKNAKKMATKIVWKLFIPCEIFNNKYLF